MGAEFLGVFWWPGVHRGVARDKESSSMCGAVCDLPPPNDIPPATAPRTLALPHTDFSYMWLHFAAGHLELERPAPASHCSSPSSAVVVVLIADCCTLSRNTTPTPGGWVYGVRQTCPHLPAAAVGMEWGNHPQRQLRCAFRKVHAGSAACSPPVSASCPDRALFCYFSSPICPGFLFFFFFLPFPRCRLLRWALPGHCAASRSSRHWQ